VTDTSCTKSQSLLKYAELLLRKGMQEEARAILQELLLEDPECARGHYTLAVVLASEGGALEAVRHFQEALRLVPDDVKALNGLGVALQQVGRVDEAAGCYREALRIAPRYQDARINLAILLKDHALLVESEHCLADGAALEPENVRFAYNLANVLHFQGRSLDAINAYRNTLRLDPQHLDAQQNLLFALHYSPRISDRQILAGHLKASRKGFFMPGTEVAQGTIRPLAGRRIRVGYVSGDFREHAVARFIEPILRHHDKSRFEIFCYANLLRPDETTGRLRGYVDQWRDIRGVSDEKAAFMIASDGIDILIDLAGHTSANRLPLFARRPAPLQITWIGYPDTTGLPQMDYRITDWLADPPGRERFHTERLIRLRRSFSCYQPPPGAPEVASLPFDSAGVITFGSFNNLAKVTPEVIALWGRVLLAVRNSRIILKGRPLADREVRARIMSGFAKAGIAAERVELHAGNPSTHDHLAQYGNIDIALDTFPYNGTTTTCEALWMGVPVVTLAGTRHASRTGVSILTNCGMPELVAESEKDYLAIARELAKDLPGLRDLRGKLRERVERSPVMDGEALTRELEETLSHLVTARTTPEG
jgi:protein O-GlcNAc transferase